MGRGHPLFPQCWALVETLPVRPTGQVRAVQVDVRPRGANWSRGWISRRPISPIMSEPRPVATAEGGKRSRMPIALPLSAIGTSPIGNPGQDNHGVAKAESVAYTFGHR